MTIKHKCGENVVENQATTKTDTRKKYNERAAMHYEGGGWSSWTDLYYIVDKCIICGNSHKLKESEVL